MKHTDTNRDGTTPSTPQAGRLVNYAWARTKHLGATDTKGPRIQAQAFRNDVKTYVTLPWDFALCADGNHEAAARAAFRKAGVPQRDLPCAVQGFADILVHCVLVHPKVGHRDWVACHYEEPALVWQERGAGTQDHYLEVLVHGHVDAQLPVMRGETLLEALETHVHDLSLHVQGGHAGLEFWDDEAERRHVAAVKGLCEAWGVKGGAL